MDVIEKISTRETHTNTSKIPLVLTVQSSATSATWSARGLLSTSTPLKYLFESSATQENLTLSYVSIRGPYIKHYTKRSYSSIWSLLRLVLIILQKYWRMCPDPWVTIQLWYMPLQSYLSVFKKKGLYNANPIKPQDQHLSNKTTEFY